MKELLFYDIECFSYDSLVVFKNINNEVVAHFWSVDNKKFDDGNGFEDVPSVIKDKILAGYNNYFYDDKMLTLMIRGLPPKSLKMYNDRLIGGDKLSDIHLASEIESIDMMQEIDVSKPSLKKIEGNMGKSIIESSVPFDIDRPLTDEEKEEVYKYCCYDVQTTIEIYKLRKHSYFDTKNELLTMVNNDKAQRWNTTTISANILLDSPLPRWIKLGIPEDKWEKIEGIPRSVWNMWALCEHDPTMRDANEKVEMFDCNFTFGFGGLHGEHSYRHRFKDVKLLDVASMYPSIIIYLNALGNATKKYDEIRQERLQVKHVDKLKSNALKLVLNSVYGNLKSQYSLLFNPLASATVCIYGQMALFDLCRRLDNAKYTLININTDGVAFYDPYPKLRAVSELDYEEIWHDWEKDWHLTLELDEFDEWWQKDVNNYIAIHNGELKVKGGDTRKYHFNPDKGVHSFFKNNDARIVQIALVDKIVYGKDVIDTIIEHMNEPILFQYILKAGHTYKGVFDEDGNQLNNVNRVFAVKKKYAGKKIYKVRQDGGYVNFPDVPDNMMVWNEDVDKIENFESIVDVNHYYSIIQKQLERWKAGDELVC